MEHGQKVHLDHQWRFQHKWSWRLGRFVGDICGICKQQPNKKDLQRSDLMSLRRYDDARLPIKNLVHQVAYHIPHNTLEDTSVHGSESVVPWVLDWFSNHLREQEASAFRSIWITPFSPVQVFLPWNIRSWYFSNQYNNSVSKWYDIIKSM